MARKTCEKVHAPVHVLQGRFDLLPLGDVAADALYRDQPARLVADRDVHLFDPVDGSVRVKDPESERAGAEVRRPFDTCREQVAVVGVNVRRRSQGSL